MLTISKILARDKTTEALLAKEIDIFRNHER